MQAQPIIHDVWLEFEDWERNGMVTLERKMSTTGQLRDQFNQFYSQK